MTLIKLTLAAATLTIGLTASAAAMPAAKIGGLDIGTIQAEQARLVCNRWGRCWRTGGWGYRGGWRHRRWRRW